jgi:hypothetical protein
MSAPHSTANEDSTNAFFLHADHMVRDAQFIVDSLPNVERFSVERALRQLHAIHLVLVNLDDNWLDPNKINGLIHNVTNISHTLQNFYDAPPAPRDIGTPTIPSTGRGRPRYDVDLDEALRLHDLGNSWESVAEAMGVTQKTLYSHLERAQLSTTRKPFTDITDDELDEKVSAISLSHPFAGSAIIMGHLEAIGVHLPAQRVQESVKRVDALGVLVR